MSLCGMLFERSKKPAIKTSKPSKEYTMFVSSFRMKGRSDKRKEIIQTLNGLSDQVRLKKGCLNVMSYQAIDDENVFCLVEEWKTKPDLDEYMNSQLYAALLGISTILVEKPEVQILVEDGSRNDGAKENGQFLFKKLITVSSQIHRQVEGSK